MRAFIDFEATQFSMKIISIGCVLENGKTYYSLINPNENLTDFIIKLTGITNEMLVKAPSAEVVFKDFFDWCKQNAKDEPITFYCYGNCDKTFVKKALHKAVNFDEMAILSILTQNIIDLSSMPKKHFGLSQAISLNKVHNYITNQEIEQSHNALDDALMLRDVYEYIRAYDGVEYGIFEPAPTPAKEKKALVIRQNALYTCPALNIKKEVRMYDKNMKLINTFENVKQCAKYIKERSWCNPKAIVKNIAANVRRSAVNEEPYGKYYYEIEGINYGGEMV